jgi:glycyl-tRNA synthetase beta chain
LKPHYSNSDYAAVLRHLSGLRPQVDAFFDAVMVMDEDLKVRENRLNLLRRLKGLFDRVADFAVIG